MLLVLGLAGDVAERPGITGSIAADEDLWLLRYLIYLHRRLHILLLHITIYYLLLTSSTFLTLGIAQARLALLSLNRKVHYSLNTVFFPLWIYIPFVAGLLPRRQPSS